MNRPVLFASLGVLASLAAVAASDGRRAWISVPDAPAAPVPQPAPSAGTARAGSFDWIENRGQWPDHVAFAGRMGPATMAAEHGSLLLSVREDEASGASVRLVFEGAASDVIPVGEDARPGIYSFFLGNDPSRWVRGLRTFGTLRYQNLYPGIDLLVHAGSAGIKYDLLLAPLADLSQVRIRCEGAEGLRLDQAGSLVLETTAGPLVQVVGRCWEVDGSGDRHDVVGRHRLIDGDTIGFHVEGRDPARALVIDPGLVWSSYLGGSGAGGVGDSGRAVAFDRDRNVTVVGRMDGYSFPMTPGAYQHPGPGANNEQDVFVTRLRASDGALIYSCVIGGGSQGDRGLAVAVDAQRRAVVAGWTASPDFPTTPNAFEQVNDAWHSAFVLRLSPTGSDLEYSTFIEGTSSFGGSEAWALELDMRTGAAIVGGSTASPTFPVTPGAFDTTVGTGDGFLARLDPTGSFLEWATYFGGSLGDWIYALDVDEQGRVVCTGETFSTDLPVTPDAFDPIYGPQSYRNAFVSRFDPTGATLEYSTYFGGEGINSGTFGYGIGFVPDGGVIVAGDTAPLGFPTTPGAFQTTSVVGAGFLARFSPSGTLAYSTFFSGTGTIPIRGLAVDSSGIATFVGWTEGQMPTTPGAWQPPTQGASSFIARLDPRGARLLYGTPFGPGSSGAQAVAITPTGRAAVCGTTRPVFPTTPGSASPAYNGGQTDAFVLTLDLFLQGAEPFGSSTGACRGPLLLNATSMPAAGAQNFSFYLSGAPPLSNGWLLLGNAVATPTSIRGVGLWLDLNSHIVRIPVVTDGDGYLDHPLPIPLGTSGRRISAQAVIRNTALCTGAGVWSASNGLTITVQ